MKVRIELVENLPEEEVIIRCRQVDDSIRKIHEAISQQASPSPGLVFYKEGQEFYFPVEEVLFFETDGEQVYAHTAKDTYRTRFRLYELEQFLPLHFVRGSKSSIINVMHIYSITRNLTASSLVEFKGTHKNVYVSRHYYQGLRQRLSERSRYEG